MKIPLPCDPEDGLIIQVAPCFRRNSSTNISTGQFTGLSPTYRELEGDGDAVAHLRLLGPALPHQVPPAAVEGGASQESAHRASESARLRPPGESASSAVSAIIRNLKESGEADKLDARALNNTRHAMTDVVFFNRVPKVGSQTFMELLRRLSLRNVFDFHRDHIQRVETIRLAPADQMNLASMVSSYTPPAVYVKHVCFVNFTQFNLPEPIYVNLVRDPVERVISWYYYVRAPWYYVERKQAFPDIPLPDPAWLKKDFETCVLRGDRECRYLEGETHEGIGDHRRQSLFFCGHSDFCTPFNTVGALERAKRAVEQHYAVVGILEDLNSTLTVLEHYVPRFFRGASRVYWDEVDRFTRINRNLFKPPVSEEVKDIVRANFTREVEFYQFCRQRLHRQLLALRLPDTK